jgi:hypothetical protein
LKKTMLKQILTACAIFGAACTFTASAQVHAAIASADALFAGLSSPLLVVLADESNQIKIEGAEVLAQEKLNAFAAQLQVRPFPGAEAVNVRELNAKGQEVGSHTFNIEPTPRPQAFFGSFGTSGDTLTRYEAREVDQVRVAIPFFDCSDDLEVTGFQLVRSQGGTLFVKASSSDQLTADMRQLLHEVLPGSLLYLEDVKIRIKGTGEELFAEPLKLYID